MPPHTRLTWNADPRERLVRPHSVASPDLDNSRGAEQLPPELIEELGRILGEALVQQFQRDTADMDIARSGSDHIEEPGLGARK